MSSLKPRVNDELKTVTLEPSAGSESDVIVGGTTSASTKSRVLGHHPRPAAPLTRK